MRILILPDVHHRPKVNKIRQKKTILGLKKIIDTTSCDLIVFLGDTVHGPDFGNNIALYREYLCAVLDCTKSIPFATVFGNHDDECGIGKKQILEIINSYPNALTDGENYVIKIDSDVLLFIDSGSYYDGEESLYDTVKPEIIEWAKGEIAGEKAILFQHIIVPDIREITIKNRFKDGIAYKGRIKESPCPPDINTGELKALSPHLKAAVFGHDHKNSFECEMMGVKLIQCPGAGLECYEYPRRPYVSLLDTETLKTEFIKING